MATRIKPRKTAEAEETLEGPSLEDSPPQPKPPEEAEEPTAKPEVRTVVKPTTLVEPDIEPDAEAAIAAPSVETVALPPVPMEGLERIPPKVDDQVLATSKPGTLDIRSLALTEWYLKSLVYGSPGVGKTVLVASAEDVDAMCPILFCDAEGGTLSIRNRKFDVVRIDSYETLRSLLQFLRSDHSYKTVILDSLTEIQRIMIKHIVREAVKDDPKHDRDVPELRDYLRLADRMRTLIRVLRDLPIHLQITCLDRETRDERDGTIVISPALMPSLAGEVCAFVDLVGYLAVSQNKETGEVIRRLIVQPTGKYESKDRSGALPGVIDGPTMKFIYGTISKKLGAGVQERS